MALYDLDVAQLSSDLLPPDKRQPLMLAWVAALLKPLQYARDLLLDSYRNGNTSPTYASGTYNSGDRVLYKNQVFESLIDTNTDLPTVQTSWALIQDNYIGVMERVQYTCQKLVFEFAINKWFNTVFRQPNDVSDIYVTTTAYTPPMFRSSASELTSSTTFGDGSTEPSFDGSGDTLNTNMTINVPVAVYNALSAVSADRDKIIRAFADKYIPVGIIYNIQTY